MNTTVEIQNLKCSGCENTIVRRLNTLEGIRNILVNMEDSTLSFEYDTLLNLEELKRNLRKIGYPITGDANNLTTKTKSYIACAVGSMAK
ncbi:copper chaperone CopZ [Saonia flava]|uniref:Copper chaperone CopZ n=1 Tax=Saonia flava TaxID=523696 RepID=A0A846QV90_9FLAO|nr:heavy metal-associated domain-containing protein [Saonia flava]NJB72191.1 copper chaperone CopZ [Saonia flava]